MASVDYIDITQFIKNTEGALLPMNDSREGYAVNAKHYVAKSPIEFMQSVMTKEQFMGFCIGNTIKYLMRADYKGQHDSDINKAKQYSYWACLAKHDKKVDPSEPIPEGVHPRVFGL